MLPLAKSATGAECQDLALLNCPWPDDIGYSQWRGFMTLVRTALMVAVFTVAARSSVIIDTFGPGDTFQPPPGELIGGGMLRGDPPPNQGVTQAFEFTPVTPMFFSSVQLAL